MDQNSAAEDLTVRAALALADRGVLVFPCAPGSKRPYVKGGYKAASTAPSQIRKWWGQWPEAMIGVPTGPWVGFVLDLDVGDPPVITGPAYFAKFRAFAGKIPATAITETPSGGLHLRFAWDPKNPVRNGTNIVPELYIPPLPGTWARDGKKAKGAQVDVGGEGGYVIVPPSVCSDGRSYRWRSSPDAGVEPATERLLAIALKQMRSTQDGVHPLRLPPAQTTNRDGDAVWRYAIAALNSECALVASTPAGNRNNTLNIAAASCSRS